MTEEREKIVCPGCSRKDVKITKHGDFIGSHRKAGAADGRRCEKSGTKR